MLSAITGYRQDDEGQWIAELACSHSQHVRHRPPFFNRPWAVTPEGRAQFLGHELRCNQCAGT